MSRHQEELPPVANNPPGSTLGGTLLFAVRRVLDLQMASVFRHIRPWLQERNGCILEVGCGAQPYRHLLPDRCRYTGLDWDRSEDHFNYRVPDTVYYSGEHFPFGDASFDSLLHTEVLEHIYRAPQFLAECRRVLRPGGVMLFTVPFQARYHYQPHDYCRYTPAALERLLQEAGFTSMEILPRGSDITVASYKCVSVIYRWLQGGMTGIIPGLLSAPAILPLLMAGHLSLRFPLGSTDDCLGYTVTASP